MQLCIFFPGKESDIPSDRGEIYSVDFMTYKKRLKSKLVIYPNFDIGFLNKIKRQLKYEPDKIIHSYLNTNACFFDREIYCFCYLISNLHCL